MEQPPPPNPPAPDLPPPQPDPSIAPTHSSSSTSLPSALISTTTTSPQNPSPNPNPNKPLTTSQSQPPYPPSQTHQPHSPNDQSRLGRPQWPQHQPSHLSHFNPSSSAASSASASFGSQRGGIAIGVPASSQSTPYSPSFGRHQFGGLGRGAASAPESSAGATTPPQVRPPVSGYQTSVSSGLGSASQMRPGVISVHQQQRPAPIRSITNSNNHPINAQNLPGHSLLRGSSVGSPGLTSPSVLQSPQQRGQPQPWLVPSQGKPPLPSHTYRGHMDPQSMQQRSQSHVPQQQLQPSQGPSQPMQASSSQQQQQSFAPHQHDQFRQAQSLRPGSSLSPQTQTARGLGHPRPASFGTAHPFQPGAHASGALEDVNESNSIVSKRSIHELVNQVDPSEKLDPEVVDILVDIAEDFVDSITTFGCLLAKHRKSNTLEAKDILLHLERNWNLTIPGFGGDEIKSYRKPVINDIHRERVAAVKNSMGAEAGSVRSLPGQQAAKGIGRAPASAMDTKP